MTTQPNLKISILLMIIFFIAGIVCYIAFPSPESGDQPMRLMFQNKAGKVLFEHTGHVDEYDLDCMECHHNLEDDEIYNCSECHEDTGDEDMPSRSDGFHMQCKGCHEDSDAGPVECNSCHAP